MESLFRTQSLAVGYDRNILLQGINIRLERGKILTLIGPNGAGKSTILKTITRQLEPISGVITISGQSIDGMPGKEFAKRTAVVLTERIAPELMTCAEVVAMGRYPYTDMFGRLSDHDKAVVANALEQVHALDLAEREFTALSDGQRQRIMLARAICQEPEIIVLDEPTAWLDIRYKIELLDILRTMAREKGTTIVMSLHEIDLAMKVSDELLCFDGEKITAYGTPEDILTSKAIENLYAIHSGSYNLLFGSVELPKPAGAPRVFVIAGNGKGTPFFRTLQKLGIPFAAGILMENDVDCQAAEMLSNHVIKSPCFEQITPEIIEKAKEVLDSCRYVLDAGTPIGTLNSANRELLRYADQEHIAVIHDLKGVQADAE